MALGEVGMVLGRERSRLTRTDKDFCHPLEVCQIFVTLIAFVPRSRGHVAQPQSRPLLIG